MAEPRPSKDGRRRVRIEKFADPGTRARAAGSEGRFAIPVDTDGTADVRGLLLLQPERLELLATLDYLFRQLKAGGGQGPWKEKVIERFMQVKKEKFAREAVRAAYDSIFPVQITTRTTTDDSAGHVRVRCL